MKFIFNSLLRGLRPRVFVLAGLLCWLAPAVTWAQATYYTPRAILAEFFPKSQLVTYQKYDLSSAQRTRIEGLLGYALKRSSYTFYVAKSGEHVDGYALLDEENGQHLPIGFAVKLSPSGSVERQEIMVYRERYGDEVRDPRFRQQFVGKTAADPLRPGEEVIAVSGATISSRAMALGVRRCLVLFDELVLRPQREAAPSPPPASH
jgi:Na+-translocating ferredoxin:NAD+ oxidoreductase subunit G